MDGADTARFCAVRRVVAGRSLCVVCPSYPVVAGRLDLCSTGLAIGVSYYRVFCSPQRFQSTKLALAFRTFQQRKVVLADLAAQIIGLMVMLGLGYLTRSVWSLVAAGLIASLVSIALGHLWFQGPNNRLQWDSSALKELIAFGRWVLLSSSVGVLAANGDRIWFGGSMSATELGVYSIAVLILGALQLSVSRLASAVALPALSEVARSGDTVRLRGLYYRFRLIVDLALLFACGLL